MGQQHGPGIQPGDQNGKQQRDPQLSLSGRAGIAEYRPGTGIYCCPSDPAFFIRCFLDPEIADIFSGVCEKLQEPALRILFEKTHGFTSGGYFPGGIITFMSSADNGFPGKGKTEKYRKGKKNC